jgi:Ca-activated chloride channel family protein
MKVSLLLFLLVVLGNFSHAQSWVDSLRAARSSMLNKDYEKALKQYKQVQQMAPKSVDLSDEIGQSAYRAGKFKESEKIFLKSSSAHGNSSQQAQLHRNIGNAQLQQKRYEEAIQSYKKALRKNPSDANARYNLDQAMKKQSEQKNQAQKNQQADNAKNKPKPTPQKPQKSPSSGSKNQNNQAATTKKNSSDKKETGATKVQLSDKKTERLLNELAKKEIETKKKFNGMKSSASFVQKSGKDW